MKVALVDYGMGNLGSVRRAIGELGAQPLLADEPAKLDGADRIILPGVGAFGDGMALLQSGGWVSALRQHARAGKPVLGICLGMQLLATRGVEGGDYEGLDLIAGEVVPLAGLGCKLRIPHVGWNSVTLRNRDAGMMRGIPEATDFYFVHSYAFRPRDPADVLATTEYGIAIPAVVARGNVMGTQFHPEKSSRAGFRLLRNFLAC